ncbi:MAG TPA: DNA double-strand break repair nuclease NurA [Acidimicrobiia bacterium]|nr:DNA double-strand break repair nuclease NurA [Acidimicrobiia bacterium]
MALFVEGWAPEYGSSVEPDEELSPAEGSVDLDIEDRPWEPVAGADDGIPVVAFVDGVRRIDARLVLDEEGGAPRPGICGSFAVGAVLWDRPGRRSEIAAVTVDRLAVMTDGRTADVPPAGQGLVYRSVSVPDTDPASLVRGFHDAMRRAEAAVAEELANGGYFVVADGPLYEYTHVPKIGYIKSHRRSYLTPPHGDIVGRLGAGERTPLFTIGEGRFRRYSWYLRLADRGRGHSWTGIVRCEASASLATDEVAGLADRAAAVLPLVASEAHIDPRAPQNLVPIAALERDLRHRLGDAGLVLRALRRAVSGGVAA